MKHKERNLATLLHFQTPKPTFTTASTWIYYDQNIDKYM
jgi:hypothetical protein